MSKSESAVVESAEVAEFVAPSAEVIAANAKAYVESFKTPAEALHALVENVSEHDRQLALFQRHRGMCWNDRELTADKNCDALYIAGVRITLRRIETEKGIRYTRSAIPNRLYDANGTFTLGDKREFGENSPAKAEDAIRYALMSFGSHYEAIVDMRERIISKEDVKVATVPLSDYEALKAELAKLKEQLGSK